MKYAIIIEKAKRNYSAYVPDLPGCVTTGKTIEEIKKMMREAIEFHIEGMKLDGEPVPAPASDCCYVEVDMAEVNKRVRQERRPSVAKRSAP